MTPSTPFDPFLRAQGLVLLDGGLATALEARGHDLRDPLWSARVLLEAPGEVREVHADYLAAGADVVATVTYQATFPGLRSRGLTEAQATEAFHRAVELAVEARDAFWARSGNRVGRLRPLVAASVGPYGAFLADGSEYTGRYGLDEAVLAEWHRPRWALLAASGADVLACETVPSFAEVRALVRLFAETPGRWGWISLQCRDDAHLADGTPVEEAARACAGAPGVAALGVNCVPPGRVAPLLRRLGSVTRAPLVAYPNSGEAYDPRGKRWHPAPAAEDPVELACGWPALGARLVGGCCRTGPETIRALRRRLLTPS